MALTFNYLLIKITLKFGSFSRFMKPLSRADLNNTLSLRYNQISTHQKLKKNNKMHKILIRCKIQFLNEQSRWVDFFFFCFTFVLQGLLMIPKWIIIRFTVTAAGPLTNKWTRREREMQMIIVVPGIFDYCFLNDGGSALVPFDSLLFRAKKCDLKFLLNRKFYIRSKMREMNSTLTNVGIGRWL